MARDVHLSRACPSSGGIFEKSFNVGLEKMLHALFDMFCYDALTMPISLHSQPVGGDARPKCTPVLVASDLLHSGPT
eukprot:3751792-Pyramimonas_sp.AAC.1